MFVNIVMVYEYHIDHRTHALQTAILATLHNRILFGAELLLNQKNRGTPGAA
jgi:hypothetical protein